MQWFGEHLWPVNVIGIAFIVVGVPPSVSAEVINVGCA